MITKLKSLTNARKHSLFFLHVYAILNFWFKDFCFKFVNCHVAWVLQIFNFPIFINSMSARLERFVNRSKPDNLFSSFILNF